MLHGTRPCQKKSLRSPQAFTFTSSCHSLTFNLTLQTQPSLHAPLSPAHSQPSYIQLRFRSPTNSAFRSVVKSPIPFTTEGRRIRPPPTTRRPLTVGLRKSWRLRSGKMCKRPGLFTLSTPGPGVHRTEAHPGGAEVSFAPWHASCSQVFVWESCC